MDDKQRVMNDIIGLVKKNPGVKILIATDMDREGEAIGYHLLEELVERNAIKGTLPGALRQNNRIVFNEITKEALEKSIDKPRLLDLDMYHAQQARRVLDRLIGFELSGVLWKHISMGLSAGRCQSPALQLIVDREKEIEDHQTEALFKISGEVESQLQVVDDKKIKASKGGGSKGRKKDGERDGEEVEEESGVKKPGDKVAKKYKLAVTCPTEFKDAGLVRETLIHSGFCRKDFIITDTKTRLTNRNPNPPFITSSLQQTVSSVLGINPQSCMSIAQKLYEAGHITYMHTDSISLSADAIKMVKKKVLDTYGEEYYRETHYKNNSKNAQEAHEAIRVVKVDPIPKLTGPAKKVYDLIWKRTVASQMAPVQSRTLPNYDKSHDQSQSGSTQKG